MRTTIAAVFLLVFNTVLIQAQTLSKKSKLVLVVHGGAGTILKSQMTAEMEKRYTDGLKRALETGYAVLTRGGTSIEAVEAAVKILEDDSLFNAGKGAVFTNEGKNELDAAIMNGKTLEAGSVAGVTTIRNPISAARAVMEKSEHVMMVGKGAEKFAASQGVIIVDPSYFYTESRWRSLQRIRKEDSAKTSLDHSDKNTDDKKKTSHTYANPFDKNWKYGTVGAVALDKDGNLAAATSTGGMTNKKFGRVGDAPLIGIGTYANNATCAISCTGWGEYFIRLVMAKSISDMMEFGKISLKDAGEEMVMKRLPALGKQDNETADGGLISVDKNGNIAMPFNSEGMYRGFIDSEGKMEIKIYKN
jgi:beta-aspartyl-peptidase (threonine type)